jgi:hypothetical protein
MSLEKEPILKSGLNTMPALQKSKTEPRIPKSISRPSNIIRTGRTKPGPVDKGSEVVRF